MIPGLNTLYAAAGVAVCIALMAVGWRFDHMRLEAKIAGRDAAIATYKADLTTCQAGKAALTDAVEAQNSAVEAARRSAARWQREAQEAVSARRVAMERANRDADAFLRRKPVGETVCARALDVSAAIREDLQ